MGTADVAQLRLVVTAPEYGQALQFYRDVLGLSEHAAYTSPGGRVTILEEAAHQNSPICAAFLRRMQEIGDRTGGYRTVRLCLPDRDGP